MEKGRIVSLMGLTKPNAMTGCRTCEELVEHAAGAGVADQLPRGVAENVEELLKMGFDQFHQITHASFLVNLAGTSSVVLVKEELSNFGLKTVLRPGLMFLSGDIRQWTECFDQRDWLRSDHFKFSGDGDLNQRVLADKKRILDEAWGILKIHFPQTARYLGIDPDD